MDDEVANEPEGFDTLSEAEAELVLLVKVRVETVAPLVAPSTGVAERKEIGKRMARMRSDSTTVDMYAALRQLCIYLI